MPNLIGSIGVNGQNLRTYLDVLTMDSAFVASTTGTGGIVYPNLDFRDHKFTVIADDGPPTKVAEGGAKPAADAVVQVPSLVIEMWAKFRQPSRQLEMNQDPAGLVRDIVGSAVPGFPIALDVEVLNTWYGGANKNTDVEYDAADPIGSVDTWLANYDETTYPASACILTRQGARKLNFAQDANNRLQSAAPGGVAALLPPSWLTAATGTQIGEATVMGAIFHGGANYFGTAMGVTVERMPQATINSQGPGTNIVNYRIESAMGWANAIDYDKTGRGVTFLVDKL